MILLQVLAVMLVATAAVTSVAHALELPGKLRLDKQTYYAVQPIYYPGFTIAGFAEPAAIIATVVQMIASWDSTTDFWLVLPAFVGMVIVHTIYWVLIHPVNNFWVAGTQMNSASIAFFSLRRREGWNPDWTELRDRWEYSHVARAIFASISLLALVVALAN